MNRLTTGSKSFSGIERQALEGELVVDHRLARQHAERIAVGRGLRTGAGADVEPAAGPVLHHERLAETLLQFLGHQPREHVATAAGSKRNDDPHRPRWASPAPTRAPSAAKRDAPNDNDRPARIRVTTFFLPGLLCHHSARNGGRAMTNKPVSIAATIRAATVSAAAALCRLPLQRVGPDEGKGDHGTDQLGAAADQHRRAQARRGSRRPPRPPDRRTPRTTRREWRCPSSPRSSAQC